MRTRALFAAFAVAGIACTEATPPLSESPSSTDRIPIVTRFPLGTLGGASTVPEAINNAGTIVGSSATATGQGHAFRWTRETGMTDLGVLPGESWSSALHISETGEIVGLSGRTPVAWSVTGAIRALSTPVPDYAWPGFAALIMDVNQAGIVVGSSYDELGGGPPARAWLWTPGDGFRDMVPGFGGDLGIAAINRSGVVLGAWDTGTYGGFLWSRTTPAHDIGQPPGGSRVDPYGLNDFGAVVGGADVSELWNRYVGLVRVPFVWTASQGFKILATSRVPQEQKIPYGQAYASSKAGFVVGTVFDGPDAGAVAWLPTGRLVRLETSGEARMVNDRGGIAGSVGPDAFFWQLGDPPVIGQ